MDANQIVADYSRDIPWGVESQRASIDKVLDEFMVFDEEKERKKRERMLQAQRAMAQVGHSSRPRGQNHVFGIHADGTPVDEGQDDAIAGGLSLAMGSAAHREYVRDRQGMDEFEQRRANLSEIGFGTKGDREAPGPDEFHEELAEDLAAQDAETAESNEEQFSKGKNAVTEVMAEHVMKHDQAERIIALARSRAAGTETTADDDFVSDVLPDVLGRKVHDVSVRNLDEDEVLTDIALDKIDDMAAELEM